jgi:hypothetical protein
MPPLIKTRSRFFLNEPVTALRLIELLINSHLMFQDSSPLVDRSLPNSIGKNLALILIKFLFAHSNIPNKKLMDMLSTGFAATNSSPEDTPSPVDSPTPTPVAATAVSDAVEPTAPASTPPPAESTQPTQQPSKAPSPAPTPTAAPQFLCQSCALDFASVVLYRQHLRSPEHQQQLRQKSSQTPTAATAPAPASTQPAPEAEEEEAAPSLVSFASNTKNEKEQEAAQAAKYIDQHTTSHVYHQHSRDDGVLDFTYGRANQHEEEEEEFYTRTPSRKNSNARSHSPRQRSNSNSSNQSHKSNNTPKGGDADSASSESEAEDGNAAFDPFGHLVKPSNAGRLSDKPGTQVQLVAIPFADNDAATSTDDTNAQDLQRPPTSIQLTKHSHPQHIILTSPTIGSLIIPASAATLSSIQSSHLQDTTENNDEAPSSLAQITTRQLPFLRALLWQFLSSLSQTTPIKTFSKPNHVMPSNLTAIIFDSGGKFAFSLMLGNIIIYHTSFANYTTRKKQGKQQSTHDKNGGQASSVGATIRRQQGLRHRERIRETLYHMRAELFYCNQILLYVPSHHLKEQLFMNQEQLQKWSQSGGSWLGSASLPLQQHTSLQSNTDNATKADKCAKDLKAAQDDNKSTKAQAVKYAQDLKAAQDDSKATKSLADKCEKDLKAAQDDHNATKTQLTTVQATNVDCTAKANKLKPTETELATCSTALQTAQDSLKQTQANLDAAKKDLSKAPTESECEVCQVCEHKDSSTTECSKNTLDELAACQTSVSKLNEQVDQLMTTVDQTKQEYERTTAQANQGLADLLERQNQTSGASNDKLYQQYCKYQQDLSATPDPLLRLVMATKFTLKTGVLPPSLAVVFDEAPTDPLNSPASQVSKPVYLFLRLIPWFVLMAVVGVQFFLFQLIVPFPVFPRIVIIILWLGVVAYSMLNHMYILGLALFADAFVAFLSLFVPGVMLRPRKDKHSSTIA